MLAGGLKTAGSRTPCDAASRRCFVLWTVWWRASRAIRGGASRRRPRVVPHVARRVAEAAIKSGVAQLEIKDFDAYEASVAARIKKANA